MRRAGLESRHELVERPDFLALPALLESQTRVDLAYIDGMHTFDHVLLDFCFLDRMLPVSGVIAFNDYAMPAVHKVVRFVLTHRRYAELDVGLGEACRRRTLVRRLMRWLERAPQTEYFRNANDRYLEKREHWQPSWDFFAEF